MELFNLKKSKGMSRASKRVGRGIGSGKGGHTTGRGQKGQKARTGYNLPFGFEGGQVPLFRKIPKSKGFVNPHKTKVLIVNLEKLNIFDNDSTINPEKLVKAGLIKDLDNKIKILGNGELLKKINFEGFLYSKAALEKISKAGGTTK